MTSPVKIWRNQKKIAMRLGKRGRIVSWTVIRIPPQGFSGIAPYAVAAVRLSQGEKIIAQVVDANSSDLKAGMTVSTVLRRGPEESPGGVISYSIKVKPI